MFLVEYFVCFILSYYFFLLLVEHFVCFLLLVEHFVLLYFKLLFLFIFSGTFCFTLF